MPGSSSLPPECSDGMWRLNCSLPSVSPLGKGLGSLDFESPQQLFWFVLHLPIPLSPATGTDSFLDFLSISAGDGTVSENKEENPQLESPEQVELRGTVSGRSEGNISQNPEQEDARESQHRPEMQQGNHPGKRQVISTYRGGGFKNHKETVIQPTLCTKEKPHKRVKCGKGFKRRSTLIVHQSVHTEERPYNCPECGKSYKVKVSLMSHQKLHTG